MIAIGTKVVVLNNRFPDVLAGTEGVIDCHEAGGYGVAIHGKWMIAGGDRGQTYDGTEVIWYEEHEIKAI